MHIFVFLEQYRRIMAKRNTRQNFILTAGKIFKQYGFRKTTMDDIAFAAGKGKSSLYYYFKNKEEVFEAVVDYEASQLQSEIFRVMEEYDSAREKLRKYIVHRMKRFAARGNLYEALNDDLLLTFSFIEKIRNYYRDWELKVIGEILQTGIDRKEFKVVNIEFLSNALLTAMIGFEMPLLQKTESDIEFENKINDVINMIFYGICT